jgi:phosphate transport system permease protein
MSKNMQQRQRFDQVFKLFCLSLTICAFLFMTLFIVSIGSKAYTAFILHSIEIDVPPMQSNLSDEELDKVIQTGLLKIYQKSQLNQNDFEQSIKGLLTNRAGIELFQAAKNKLSNAPITLSYRMNKYIIDGQELETIQGKFINYALANKLVNKSFNWRFFFSKESRDPEFAGIITSLFGTLMTIAICLVVAIPLSALTAIYLEELSNNKTFYAKIIETNISNLASVPSIVYGILGLAIYVEFFDLPRSSSLVGGLTLMLITIPNLIITYRQALKSVPKSIKYAALSLGASKQQMVFDHVLAYSIPGMVTGTILIIARIIGETAPLLLIGMAAFITDLPTTIWEPATVMPIQIFLWSDSPENGFVEKSSAAIIVLLSFLLVIALFALKIRKKYTIKW